MSTQAWPFLVSRNPSLDYRTIVAPDFICQGGIPNLLARVAEGNLTEKDSAISRKIYGSKVGDFTIFFQITKAIDEELDHQNGENVLKDQFGREIYLIEGLVIKGLGEISISQNIFDQSHLDLMKLYRLFWYSIEPLSVVSSSSIYISTENENLLKIKTIEPFKAENKKAFSRPKENNFSIAIGLILLAILLTGILFAKILFHYSN